ncbi:MAG: ABC transporter substrate-binding protein [Clostridia bacterium]|jgi:iron complex transport system substrate-binding protein|nr:ABC transporter substrate-binding protein [Clostridiales bacterium]
MKNLRRPFFLLTIVATAVLLASCFSVAPQPSEKVTQEPASKSGGTFPMKITDFEGREVTIQKPPERIVTLAPGVTEILFELGLGENVVGVTDFDDYPEEVFSVPKVGDFQGPNMEAITAQKPDIIFASTLSGKNSMEALQRLGIPVLVLEAKSIEQIYHSIDIIGKLTGNTAEGDALITDMKERMEDIQQRVSAYPKKRVYYIVDINGNFTAGRGTFIDYLITLAGGENVAGDSEGWAQYSMEKIAEQNPEVIIAPGHAGNIDALDRLPGYSGTDAVKNGRVYVISDDNIISRTSYRIVQGLEEIARFLHPEAF